MNQVDHTTSTASPANQSFWLGDRLIEPQLNQVTCEGEVQHVEHRVMRVLALLAANAGEPVSREQILSSVWGDATPNDEALTQAICKLRKVLGDQPGQEETIQTIRKIGYRLVAPVSDQSPASEPSTHVIDLTRPGRVAKRHVRIRLDGRWVLGAAALLTALLITVVLSVSGVQAQSRDSAHAQAIRAVIGQDAALGATRNHAPESMPISQAIAEYVEGLDGLDVSACPPDFAEALKRHEEAWRKSIGFFEQYSDLRGELHEIFTVIEAMGDEHRTGFNAVMAEILSTWEWVEIIMLKYGVGEEH